MTRSTLLLPPTAFLLVALTSAQAPRTVWDGVYTREQAQRGEKLYEQECGRCHGDDLTGIARQD